MKILSLHVPLMFGDHHVVDVRRLVMELPGVEEVYASSAFHTLEINYDDSKLTPDKITKILEDAGYLGELLIVEETGEAAVGSNGDQKPHFRHSVAYKQLQDSVGFAQKIPSSDRPLWPCPGMGKLNTEDGS